MRRTLSIPVICLLSAAVGLPAFAANNSSVDAPTISCGNGVPGGINCIASKKDLKEARTAYGHGLKLHDHGRLEEALAQFNDASRLAPQDVLFLSAREVTKAQLVFQHTEGGDKLLAEARREQAVAEYRAALMLDPENSYTQQRLEEAMRDPAATGLGGMTPLLADSVEIHLQPKGERATFHYRGDVRGLFSELGSAYGVQPEFDDSVAAKTVRFYVDDVDFLTALHLASRATKTMWTPLDAHQFLVAADTNENHKQFDRMSFGTFAVPGANTPQEVTELVTSLRNICDFQKISTGQGGTLDVRAPQPMLRACATLLHQLTNDRPQVMIDVQVFQINHNLTRNIGLHIPNTFNLFNIPVAALAALGGQNIQSLINQLIASGGINQAGSSSLSALLAQLQGQQNSIFSQPLATFGGGLTFMGLSLDQITAALSLNESWSRTLDHITMHTAQGNEATFHLGQRFPILNASYAPIFNSPQISAVLGNQSYVPPFPSVSYEDLGLNLKAKPVIHGNGEMSMSLELQVRSLTGQSANGVPVISNKEYKGSIRLRDGEPAVVAGEISSSDQRSLSGIPGLGFLPGLNQAMVNNTVTKEDDELLIVITPHIIANHDRETDEIWVSEK
ncbi:MAG: repeat protein [Candidatus Sulfotelmatobacter sp.]|nr:repeat protein [Candidatus Sulfotelmatobacter sp.]